MPVCSEQSPPGKFFEVYEFDQSMRHGHTNWIIQIREDSWGRMVWWSLPRLSKGATKCFVASRPLYVTNIQDMATTDGAQQTWPPWKSESDISQQTLKWFHTCPRGPLDTMGPSDGHPDENFLKWSSRTACNLRGLSAAHDACHTSYMQNGPNG